MQSARAIRRNFVMDTDHSPLVVTTITGEMVEADWVALFEQWEQVFARKQRIVCITDGRVVRSRPSPKQRQLIAEWTERVDPQVRAWSLGHATVVDNALIRGVLTAIGWIHTVPVPQPFFTSLADAGKWSIERLMGAGVAVPPSVRSFLASCR